MNHTNVDLVFVPLRGRSPTPRGPSAPGPLFGGQVRAAVSGTPCASAVSAIDVRRGRTLRLSLGPGPLHASPQRRTSIPAFSGRLGRTQSLSDEHVIYASAVPTQFVVRGSQVVHSIHPY